MLDKRQTKIRETRFHIRFSSHYTWCDKKVGWRVFLAGPGHPSNCPTCIKRAAVANAQADAAAARS